MLSQASTARPGARIARAAAPAGNSRPSLRPQLAPRRTIQIANAADTRTETSGWEEFLEYMGLNGDASSKDPYNTGKELDRRYRRTVYQFPEWKKHRETSRYWRNMQTITGSRIIRSLAPPMLWVTFCATATGVWNTAAEAGALPHASVPMTPVNLTSFALSLLLVFRTNSSYGRWDEARKIWGGILNRSRDLVRQGQTFFPEGAHAERGMLARWMVAHNFGLMCHLRATDDVREVMGPLNVLTPHELELLAEAPHMSLYPLQVLSEVIDSAEITDFQRLQMHENVTFFHDALGGCERLLRTPIPLSYTRHTCRFLLIWLSILPLAIWDQCQWTTVPVCALVAFLLLAIEEIGVQIEEPFSILPLEVISGRAQIDIEGMQGYQADVKKMVKQAMSNPSDERFTPTNPVYNLDLQKESVLVD